MFASVPFAGPCDISFSADAGSFAGSSKLQRRIAAVSLSSDPLFHRRSQYGKLPPPNYQVVDAIPFLSSHAYSLSLGFQTQSRQQQTFGPSVSVVFSFPFLAVRDAHRWSHNNHLGRLAHPLYIRFSLDITKSQVGRTNSLRAPKFCPLRLRIPATLHRKAIFPVLHQ